jgi:hypothetical protein
VESGEDAPRNGEGIGNDKRKLTSSRITFVSHRRRSARCLFDAMPRDRERKRRQSRCPQQDRVTPPHSPRLPSVNAETASCQQSLSAVKNEAAGKRTHRTMDITSKTLKTIEEKSDGVRDEKCRGRPIACATGGRPWRISIPSRQLRCNNAGVRTRLCPLGHPTFNRM